MDIDIFGIQQWVHYEAHMMFGSVRNAVIVVVIGIDIYYRIEWFELHTPLSEFLAPLFGG